MRDTKLRTLGGLPASVAVSALAFVSALPFARLDFDPHHDGVMVATAVAIRDGATVHRDVFAQYGPVAPLLQAFALKFLSEPAVALRLVNVLAIAVVAFALADLGRRAPTYWPVSLSAGRWAALAWIAVADYFLWVPQLPWSSTIAAAMTAGILWLIARVLFFVERTQEMTAYWLVVAAAVLLALLPFTRVNVGVGTLAAAAGVTGISIIALPSSRRLAAVGLAAWSAASLIILAAMGIAGALVPWWEQSILWPTQWAGAVGNQLGPDTYAKEALYAFWPALIAVGSVVAATPWWSQRLCNRRVWVSAVSVVTAICLLLVFYRNPDLPRIFLAAQVDGRNAFLESLTRGTLTLLTFLVVVVVVVAVVGTARSIPGFVRGGVERPWAVSWFLLVGFAFAGLLQYWPVPDSRHIWWGLPVGLVVLMAAFGRVRVWSPLRNPMALVLGAAGVAAMFAGPAYLAVPRAPELGTGIASGMTGIDGEVQRRSETIQALERTVGDGEASFLVAEGAWSSYDGRFHSRSPYFVSWGRPAFELDQVVVGRLVVLDSESREEFSDRIAKEDWSLLESSPEVLIYETPGLASGP